MHLQCAQQIQIGESNHIIVILQEFSFGMDQRNQSQESWQYKNEQISHKSQIHGSESDEEEVHIIDTKTQEYKIMKMSQINENTDLYEDPKTKGYEKITANIKNWTSDKTLIKLETHYFQVYLTQTFSDKKKSQNWEISRRYSDFHWLFNALNYSYPGCILPYFPVKSIENFMTTKLGIQLGEQTKQEQMHLRKIQLQNFINKICCHQILRKAEETKIFLKNSTEQFQKKKQAIQAQIQEAKSSQSSTNGIVSIFQRGMAWITSNNTSPVLNIEDIQGWSKTQQQIAFWLRQYQQILEKLQNMILIKNQEIQWDGPDTQLDIVENFKAKVISGRQYNQLFSDDISHKILKSMEYETKSLKQLQAQLQQRQNIINIINYILKFTNDINRCNKLIRKKQTFESNMIKQWPCLKKGLKEKVRDVHGLFMEAWKSHCNKMYKIWKVKH